MLCTYIHICINLYCKDVRECVCVRACVPKAAITSREFQDELSQREFDIFRTNPLSLFFDIAWPLAFFFILSFFCCFRAFNRWGLIARRETRGLLLLLLLYFFFFLFIFFFRRCEPRIFRWWKDWFTSEASDYRDIFALLYESKKKNWGYTKDYCMLQLFIVWPDFSKYIDSIFSEL